MLPGVGFNCINCILNSFPRGISCNLKAGCSGVVGHSAIATAKPDGYTIGVATVEIGMMHRAGLTELTGEDYTPIALYNYDA